MSPATVASCIRCLTYIGKWLRSTHLHLMPVMANWVSVSLGHVLPLIQCNILTSKPAGLSSAIIQICTMHFTTIFILCHQWPLTHFLFGRHFFFFLAITSEIINTCVSITNINVQELLRDSIKYFTFVGIICSFISMIL